MNKYIIATIRPWNIESFLKLKKKDTKNDWYLIKDKSELTYERIKEIDPKYIFFPHWSWKIPKEIYENFNCIIFHMTGLPYGRGGSPLQNLILRGHNSTVISAIQATGNIDTGLLLYTHTGISLDGPALLIYKRCSDKVFEVMIPYIIKNNPTGIEQDGDVVEFKRRIPEESDISKINGLKEIYDYIRMLDADEYPRPFIEKDGKRFEFWNAEIKDNYIKANVKIEVLKK